MWCEVYFDILHRVGVSHEYDRQTDRIYDSKDRTKLRCAVNKPVMADYHLIAMTNATWRLAVWCLSGISSNSPLPSYNECGTQGCI